jgi:hypothetical protein
MIADQKFVHVDKPNGRQTAGKLGLRTNKTLRRNNKTDVVGNVFVTASPEDVVS